MNQRPVGSLFIANMRARLGTANRQGQMREYILSCKYKAASINLRAQCTRLEVIYPIYLPMQLNPLLSSACVWPQTHLQYRSTLQIYPRTPEHTHLCLKD